MYVCMYVLATKRLKLRHTFEMQIRIFNSLRASWDIRSCSELKTYVE